MLREILEGRIPDTILVGVGPGSFTGIRVGIAAAQGLSIGWGAKLSGLSSLALLAVGGEAPLAVAVRGGHGELLVQQFDTFRSPGPMRNLVPAEAATVVSAHSVIGSGAASLVEARGWGEAVDALPCAADALRLPESLRILPPSPLYARAPDAIARAAA
jgi:tRNA threonylcarbamoyl adenosine modification protein YeaZ